MLEAFKQQSFNPACRSGIVKVVEEFMNIRMYYAKMTTGLSTNPANIIVRSCIDHKILEEATSYQRNRVFVFDEYVRMF